MHKHFLHQSMTDKSFSTPWDGMTGQLTVSDAFPGEEGLQQTAFEMWWRTRRNQSSSFGDTDESI